MATITFERWENGLDLRIDKRASDANRLAGLDNAFITTGRRIRKRPGLTKVGQLEVGTKGLVAGATKLETFYAGGSTITHANSLFHANQIPGASGQPLASVPSGFLFNGFLYVAGKYTDGSINHHFIDGVIPPIVTDPNCPNSASIQKTQEKIYGPDNDVTRYCKTGDPRDWTEADDAGFIAHGLQAEGDPEATAVSLFHKQLAIFMIDSVQTWNVDPDPANISIADNVFGVGTKFELSPLRLAGDTIFLSVQGFRSITLAVLNENAQDVDVGSPIDELVVPTVNTGINPISVYSQSNGQMWTIVGNYVWVFTVSKVGKISAWSRYTYPFNIDAACAFKGDLYLRSGDNVYKVDATKFTDDGTAIPVRVVMSYVDMKLPGEEKQIFGVDAILKGTANLQLLYNPKDDQLITQAIALTEDTAQGELTPVEVQAVKVAPVITHDLDELFELETLTLYYEPTGVK